ncbi:putative CRAL-TRIO lipid binding domain, CRAL/TRIO domain, CRAL/TRIO domain superfamily [Helianthus annuus]|uniref:CRAL-TRIO lipid binding domain, CRAL/TRIO domain, CRAL/TRIO domain superfamily n=1 Tax=Helianthus annuus TaxID=4232 RepID=A0A251TZZ6_HELAN|nr:CRAL-TRIO domain-containing protein YKL091C isoform X1 [Helianthus annuus]KAF5793055.1 putative CRAL-TRIO lipid binding domain, CRAL/TRIO domain, CRAL/TRIO domain superfamily [Helianthus annuus]KAJ0536757.1 putative CRAL-TRIO lipid binding domain, CRAL/TRIO domain, CRAL/TRIO domain superfamily [Helianthus annuus]KAJ0544364.1 putative CRAL-TRIO lipid binding domain, CRAL/TRIO domain, CRAL/TRIO domain superfamily [Helianthus annuus]KAJ0709367.1 putative CRAL-TRIO lipid binding domain, CRAL/TRI
MEGKAVVDQQSECSIYAKTGKRTECVGVNNDRGRNQEELKKTAQMRDLLEKHDPTSKDYDDQTIRRFLQARDLDIDKACAMFLKYLKWRKTFVPNGSISVSDVENEIAQNKMFMQGSDKIGRPITVVFGGRHLCNKKGGVEEFKRFVVFGLDKVCARIPQGQDKFVAIGDLQGWGYSCCDIRGYLAALSILQDYYPERLGKLFILHVPYVFMTAWKMVYPFIDEKTKQKIVFVENKQLKSTLLKDIDEDQLPDIYGGNLKLAPIQDV